MTTSPCEIAKDETGASNGSHGPSTEVQAIEDASHPCPVDRIPTEILGIIFSSVETELEDKYIDIPYPYSVANPRRYPFVFCHVSHQWRQAALGCSVLWSHIRLFLHLEKRENQLDCLSEVLERHRGRYLLVAIQDNKPYQRRKRSRAEAHKDEPNSRLLNLLLQNSNRIYELRFSIMLSPTITEMVRRQLSSSAGQFESLQNLHFIYCDAGSPSQIVGNAFLSAPRLCNVEVRGADFEKTIALFLPPNQIRHLSCFEISVANLVQVLKQATGVEHLRIVGLEHDLMSPPYISLPQLKQLEVDADNQVSSRRSTQFLGSVSAPLLGELSTSSRYVKHLLRMHTLCPFRLISLSIADIYVNDQDELNAITTFISSIPTLISLRLRVREFYQHETDISFLEEAYAKLISGLKGEDSRPTLPSLQDLAMEALVLVDSVIDALEGIFQTYLTNSAMQCITLSFDTRLEHSGWGGVDKVSEGQDEAWQRLCAIIEYQAHGRNLIRAHWEGRFCEGQEEKEIDDFDDPAND